MAYERAVAYKENVMTLLSGSFHASEGEYKPSYIEVNGKRISRANVVGTIARKEGFETILDDGTGEIALVAFSGELDKAKEGDVIRAIGKVREREGARNLVVESIWPVPLEYLELRRLELGKKQGDIKEKPQNSEESGIMLQIEEMDVE